MNRNLLHSKRQFPKVRRIGRKIDFSVNVPGCACILVFHEIQAYHEMINGLADAKSWTGYDYPAALDKATLIIN